MERQLVGTLQKFGLQCPVKTIIRGHPTSVAWQIWTPVRRAHKTMTAILRLMPAEKLRTPSLVDVTSPAWFVAHLDASWNPQWLTPAMDSLRCLLLHCCTMLRPSMVFMPSAAPRVWSQLLGSVRLGTSRPWALAPRRRPRRRPRDGLKVKPQPVQQLFSAVSLCPDF